MYYTLQIVSQVQFWKAGRCNLDVDEPTTCTLAQSLVSNPCIEAKEYDHLMLFVILLDRKATE